jgi:putative transferase (TIGR04331 family)
MVLDNPITTFLEALVANIPTIVFWNPDRWEFRVEAQPYFDNLREVGILWDNPEDAAAKLESIYGDPWAWWGSDAVQESRRRFVNRYGLSNNNWASQWAKALKEEANLYKAVNV